MRPEHVWNKPPPGGKKKTRKSKRSKPLTTRSQNRAIAAKQSASSPPTDASSPEEADVEPKNRDNSEPTRSPNKRANSAEPPKSTAKHGGLSEIDAIEALKRAIQSSPARNMDARGRPAFLEPNLTPKPVCRTLFPPAKGDGAMKTLSDAFINGLRRSPRSASKKTNREAGAENNPKVSTDDGLDDLFEDDDDAQNMEFPGSPTPKQKARPHRIFEKKLVVEKGATHNGVDSHQPPTSHSRSNTSNDSRGDGSRSPCPQNSSAKNYPNIDQLMLDMFASEADSIAQPGTSYRFSPSKSSVANDWADWDQSAYLPQNECDLPRNEKASGTQDSASGKAISKESSNKENSRKDQGPAQSERPRSPFQDFLDRGFQENLNEASIAPESDIFDPSLVDPQLLDMWSKDMDSLPQISNDDIDTNVLSALMREVTDTANNNP